MVKIFCKETILGAFVSLMIHGKEVNQDWCINLEKKLPSAVGSGLIFLKGTLGAVLDTIFGRLVKGPGGMACCPTFTGKNVNGFTQFCSVRSPPGGIP